MKSATKNNVFLWFATEKRLKKDKSEEDDPAEMGEALLGRVEFELFDEDTPRTCKNFRSLASGEKGKGKSGKKMHYKDTPVHRVVAGKFVQSGDFVKGTGGFGESVFGGSFKDEPKGLKKTIGEAGVLAMANGGKNSNTSQFFVTLAACPDLEGSHVVFGRVVAGMEVIERIAAYHARHEQAGQEGWAKVSPVFIWQCGVCD